MKTKGAHKVPFCYPAPKQNKPAENRSSKNTAHSAVTACVKVTEAVSIETFLPWWSKVIVRDNNIAPDRGFLCYKIKNST